MTANTYKYGTKVHVVCYSVWYGLPAAQPVEFICRTVYLPVEFGRTVYQPVEFIENGLPAGRVWWNGLPSGRVL